MAARTPHQIVFGLRGEIVKLSQKIKKQEEESVQLRYQLGVLVREQYDGSPARFEYRRQQIDSIQGMLKHLDYRLMRDAEMLGMLHNIILGR